MRLAAVVPTLDEAASLERALRGVRALADIIVVADGGSTDSTLAIARTAGVVVVESSAGRGGQLNAGARAALEAGAEIVVFVHADTVLPAGARSLIEGAVAGGAAGGGFEVRFDDPRRLFALGSRIVNLRTRILRIPLGDQAQFVTRDAYLALRGFREWPILEDLDLMRRLKRHGRVAVLRAPATTATRRFVERGIARTIATNWSIWALYFAGVDPARLARLYPPRRQARRPRGSDAAEGERRASS
jgi:rSAM/selenodomain-associated transferase 2